MSENTTPTPPPGFNLDAEKAREAESQKGGIYGRIIGIDEMASPPTVDEDGSALGGDDDAVDAPDAGKVPADV